MALGWVPGLKTNCSVCGGCLFVWKHACCNLKICKFKHESFVLIWALWSTMPGHGPSWMGSISSIPLTKLNISRLNWTQREKRRPQRVLNCKLLWPLPWRTCVLILNFCMHVYVAHVKFFVFCTCMIESGFACYQSAGSFGQCLWWHGSCWTTTSSRSCGPIWWCEPRCSPSSDFADPSLHVRCCEVCACKMQIVWTYLWSKERAGWEGPISYYVLCVEPVPAIRSVHIGAWKEDWLCSRIEGRFAKAWDWIISCMKEFIHLHCSCLVEGKARQICAYQCKSQRVLSSTKLLNNFWVATAFPSESFSIEVG